MKAKSYPYNDFYDPAFPSLPVVIQNSEEGLRTEAMNALLDTGGDGTLVPIFLLQEINAQAIQETRIRSHWGEWRITTLFLVDITVGDLTLPGVFVVGDDEGSEVILGRNVLNKLRLELDGLANLTKLPSQ